MSPKGMLYCALVLLGTGAHLLHHMITIVVTVRAPRFGILNHLPLALLLVTVAWGLASWLSRNREQLTVAEERVVEAARAAGAILFLLIATGLVLLPQVP